MKKSNVFKLGLVLLMATALSSCLKKTADIAVDNANGKEVTITFLEARILDANQVSVQVRITNNSTKTLTDVTSFKILEYNGLGSFHLPARAVVGGNFTDLASGDTTSVTIVLDRRQPAERELADFFINHSSNDGTEVHGPFHFIFPASAPQWS